MRVPPIFFPLILVLTLAPWAFAQEQEAVAEKPLPHKDQKPANAHDGLLMVIDEAFTKEHENTLPSAEFSIIMPRHKDLLVLPGGQKSGVPELVRFTLPDPGKSRILEILRFGNLTLPVAPLEERIRQSAELLKEKGFPMFTAGYLTPKILDMYITRVNDRYDAVAMHMEMSNDKGANYLAMATVIMRPDEADGVLAYLIVDRDLSGIKTSDDLRTNGMGLSITHSLKFHDTTTQLPSVKQLPPAPKP